MKRSAKNSSSVKFLMVYYAKPFSSIRKESFEKSMQTSNLANTQNKSLKIGNLCPKRFSADHNHGCHLDYRLGYHPCLLRHGNHRDHLRQNLHFRVVDVTPLLGIFGLLVREST